MMECNWNSSSLPWLARDEQDFPLGAKDASYLPSATNIDLNHDVTDLPDWMESRDIMVHPDDSLSVFPTHPEQMEVESSSQGFGGFLDTDEDYGLSINPDDMLVPLSELQPEKYVPQNTILPVASASKVSVRVSKVRVPKNSVEHSGIQNSTERNAVQPYSSTSVQSTGSIEQIEDLQNYNADELLNELIYLANREPNHLASLIESLDSSLVQAGMDELLSQLNSDNANQEMPAPSANQEMPAPLSPACVPSPVPSVGSLSPQSTVDYSFHQLLSPVYYGDEVTPKSEKVTVVLSPLSVSHTDYSSSVSSPDVEETSSVASPAVEDNLSVASSVNDEVEAECDYIETAMHSYSRSPRKSKSKRKSSTSSPYPESRKERKKEQNKQAALRYRQKKKLEDDELMTKIHAEEERQKKLKAKYSNLKQELTYLKKIMREVLIANGTLSPEAFKKK